jgi:hypothetical protein
MALTGPPMAYWLTIEGHAPQAEAGLPFTDKGKPMAFLPAALTEQQSLLPENQRGATVFRIKPMVCIESDSP